MRPLESTRWPRLSPLLDELLELDAPARAAHLAQIRAGESELADELEALLAGERALDHSGFLEDGAMASIGGVAHGGSVVGAYTLISELGAGGMGSVWLARRSDGRFEGLAAVKLPHPGVLAKGGAERFSREARLLGLLSHPHIAALLDAGVTLTGQPYLVIEHVEGDPIDEWCDAHDASTDQRLRLFLDVLGAVEHAHHKLVLHRDLKPGNILVTAGGRVKLLDFGIAKLLSVESTTAAQTTALVFTPDYAAPEQVQGGELTTAADVYAAGVLLYQLLCGRHPTATPAQSRLERMRAVIETDAPRLSVAARSGSSDASRRTSSGARTVRRLRGDLDNIVAKALKKEPSQRYATAAAMADDLRRHLDGEPISVGPDTIGYRAAKFVSRHRLSVGAASATALALLAGLAIASWQAIEARRERDEARYQAERALARDKLFGLMLGAMCDADSPLTQRQILERSVQLVDKSFAGEPGIAVELLLPIAGQYFTLGDGENDYAVMRRAAVFAAASGDANLIAKVACDTVNTHLKAGRTSEAEAQLRIATDALGRSANVQPGVRTECLTAEADLARGQGDTARALERVSTALSLAEQSGDTRGNTYPSMLSLKGVLLQDAGDLPAALATHQRLMRIHEEAGRTLDALASERNAAGVMMDMGEYAAAKVEMDHVLAHWQEGAGAGSIPAFVQLTHARVLVRFGDYAAAERVLVDVRKGAPDEPTMLALSNFFAAQAALALGDVDAADRLLADPAGVLARLSTRSRGNTLATLRALALLAHGSTGDATRLVDQELARLDPVAARDAGARAATLRVAARIALERGDATRAETLANAAVAAADRVARDPRQSADAGEALLLLARAQRALGRRGDAVATARRAMIGLTAGLSSDHPLTREALAITNG